MKKKKSVSMGSEMYQNKKIKEQAVGENKQKELSRKNICPWCKKINGIHNSMCPNRKENKENRRNETM